MNKEEKEFINFELRKKRPKKNAKTYKIETVQDMLDAVNEKNIKKFLREFEIVLRSGMLMKAINEGLKKEGKVPKDAKIKMPYYDWIDD